MSKEHMKKAVRVHCRYCGHSFTLIIPVKGGRLEKQPCVCCKIMTANRDWHILQNYPTVKFAYDKTGATGA